MSYKNSSQFGSHLPSDCSESSVRTHSFGKIKSNATVFEDHGNPWHGEEPARTPRLSPDGTLRMSRRAHLYCLLTDAQKRGNLLHPSVAPHEEQSDDLSFSTEHCRPIDIRLAKENNTIHPPLKAASKPSSRRHDLLVDVAAKLRAKRASHLIKVK